MELWQVLLGIAIFLIVLVLILFPEARSLAKGAVRIFIKDTSTTPDGARMIYEEKINEVQEQYNKAKDALKLAAGRLENENKKLDNLNAKLKTVESECEALVKAGRMESATIKSEERSEILSDINRCNKLISAYTAAKKEAEEVHKACETNLRSLKREAKEIVENMRVKEQLSDVFDSVDDLKTTSGTDKLLNSIRERNEDLNATVAGARVLHENKTSTKVQRANEEAKKVTTDDYLASLQKKYNK